MSILYDYDPQHSVGDVPSPCIGVCKMDAAHGWCAGCFRTIPELTQWSSAGNELKRQVWIEIKQRMFVQSS